MYLLIKLAAKWTGISVHVGMFILITCLVPANAQTKSSFEYLQEVIFAQNCTGCHGGSSPTAGMNLGSATAYAHIVGVTPRNSEAVNDGLKRITPGDPEKSLLFRKIDRSNLPENYGSPMPFGRSRLPDDYILFVRQWIEAGAPDTGQTSDPSLLGVSAIKRAVLRDIDIRGNAGTTIRLVVDPMQFIVGHESRVSDLLGRNRQSTGTAGARVPASIVVIIE